MQTSFAAGESSPLLSKSEGISIANYSSRTVETSSTSEFSRESDTWDGSTLPDQALAAGTNHQCVVGQKEEAVVVGSVVAFETVSDARKEQLEGTVDAVVLNHDRDTADQEVDGMIIDDIVDQVNHVAEAFLVELQDAMEGEQFLEMGLTRNLSILPSDMAAVAVEEDDVQKPSMLPNEEDLERGSFIEKQEEIPPAPPPLSAYFLLLCAVISLSSIGPLLQLQTGASATMKTIWRTLGTAMLLTPVWLSEIWRHGFPTLTLVDWLIFLCSAIGFGAMNVTFALCLQYTTVGNAVILANSMVLILLVGKLLTGHQVSTLEGCGAVIAFCGAALCSKDSADTTTSANGFLGDVLAIMSALGGVCYMVFAKVSREKIPVGSFMCMTMATASCLLVTVQSVVLGETVSFGMDRTHGVFGFLSMDADRFPLEVAIVVVCNCFGTMGYVRAMQYFDNVAISAAALLEPVMAEFLALAMGVGVLPGWYGWLGNLLVAGGTYAVIYQGNGKGGGGGMH